MNLPNLLTIIRFILVPVYWGVFFSEIPGRVYWSLGIVLLAGLTDVVDGYIARKHKQVTQLGIMLDPLADKCMLIAVFLSLLLSGVIGISAAIAILIRELAMIIFSAIFHFRGKKTVPANLLGKLTTVLFYVVLFMLMLHLPAAQHLLWVVIGLSYLASLIYISQFRSLNRSSHAK
ncbi:cardiolipin synthase [Seinonella peptonophila]|uniref:CDP-diacylglycerol--glycerol-3-phosphate 3-phosphatidyltransferase n=1 Tax=Seinonella peptonophila TaxID=112248 RepID=A0A1M4XS77_9BACL|nr:CDP-alcohol phosphatidyltransferase family protein [Seinonella peptonophila]SHE96417.1 cardiolipin synthase [Seinonella peptonophila]